MGSIHDCSICFNSFNDHKNRPLILPCGHTFCKACLQREQRGGGSQCFLDRKPFPTVSRLTTNYILLQAEARHSGSQQAAATAAGPQGAGGTHAGKGWLSRGVASLYHAALYLSVLYVTAACGWYYMALSSVTSFVGYTVLGLGAVVTGLCILLFAWEGVQWVYDKCRSKSLGLTADEIMNAQIATALAVYFAIVLWAHGWLTMLVGIVLPFCVPNVLDFGSLYLCRLLYERHRGTYIPRRPLLLGSQADSTLSDRLCYILRLEAVLVSRWSSADAHGLITCYVAAVWLFAVMGPRALLAVAAVFGVRASFLKIVHSICKSCALLKRHWDKAGDMLQDADLVSLNGVVFLILAALPVYTAGGWWYVLHYANTVGLVIWACALPHRNAELLSGLLNIAADGLGHYTTDSDMWGGSVFMVFLAHLLYVCWCNGWLLVPVLSLIAVLVHSMHASGAHNNASRFVHPDDWDHPGQWVTLGGSDNDEEDDEAEDESYDEDDDADDEEEDESSGEEDDEVNDEGISNQAFMNYMDDMVLRRHAHAISSRIEADMNRMFGGAS